MVGSPTHGANPESWMEQPGWSWSSTVVSDGAEMAAHDRRSSPGASHDACSRSDPTYGFESREPNHDRRSSGDVPLPRHVDGPPRPAPSARRIVALRDRPR